ncbi:oligosaccharide flippase family protein [Flavobacterium sp.]|uniref:oligosaccharide flippase family protein n=1 Tax=Flavobacterium sp. TaxID=239 RepID=UPI002B4B4259|nr:oligosaccharide flippase family protein [Flavobacterium sp.]HLP63327.1 oligosaccharide flippase family protein [Flavobacterium sp.]
MIKKLLDIFQNKQFHKLSLYGFGQLFNLVTPLLVIPYIVSICGEENFGKTAVGMALCFFLMVFIDYGSDLVGVREISINRDDFSQTQRIFATNYLAKTILLSGVLFVCLILFQTIPFFSAEKKMFLLGLTLLIGQFLNPTWFLQGVENVKWITFSNIISKSIYLLLIFLFIKEEQDYVLINLFWGIGMIISNGLFFFLIIKKYKFSFSSIHKKDIFQFLRRDFKMFGSQIFVSIQMYSPVILISYFGTNLMAGQYKIVEQVILIFKTYILLFFNYVFPNVCYLLEKSKEKGIYNWKLFNGANFIFVLVSMVVFYNFSYDIVSYFNPTNRYALSNLLQLAVFYPVLFAISIPLKQLVLAWNFNQFYVNLTSIAVLLNIIAIVILLPQFQVYGVFYSLLFIEGIMILFYLICIRKKLFSKEETNQ